MSLNLNDSISFTEYIKQSYSVYPERYMVIIDSRSDSDENGEPKKGLHGE